MRQKPNKLTLSIFGSYTSTSVEECKGAVVYYQGGVEGFFHLKKGGV